MKPPIRGETFVSRKITRALARIELGLQDYSLFLGNLDAKRDWGHAKDYVEAQWLMLQQDKPEDFVIASGTQHSVRDFVEKAAKQLDIHLYWQGKGLDEKGYDHHGNCIVDVDARSFRPSEVESLLGDARNAQEKLGWTPKISFNQLVKEMVMPYYHPFQNPLTIDFLIHFGWYSPLSWFRMYAISASLED